MSRTENTELNMLIMEKQIVIRKDDRHEITKEEYESQIEILDKKISEIRTKLLNDEITLRQQKDEEEKRRIESMPEELKKKDGPKRVRGPKKDSYASVIMEVLQKKSIKNFDQAADATLEKKPGRDRAKVRAQIVVMVNEVKKGKKPAYTWDEANFQLNPKA